MAGRPKDRRFYVYVVRDGVTPLYVGKGTGRRAFLSAATHKGVAEIVKRDLTEQEAYAAEVDLIAQILPQNNRNRGGAGGCAGPVLMIPLQYRGILSEAEMRRALREAAAFKREFEEVGPRRLVARYLLSQQILPHICASKIEKIREVAHGGWA